jgi:two-component system LytT family response regulator
MKIVILDDELNAVKAIESAIKIIGSEYEIVGTTCNPYEAAGIVLKENPDIVFLDIEMPQMTGFDFLNLIPDITFDIIFVTAYEQYALQAIKNNAIDYIIKPASISEIKASLEKVKQKSHKSPVTKEQYKEVLQELNTPLKKRLKIPVIGGFEFINVNNIISIKADGVYSEALMENNESIIITKNIKTLEESFSNDDSIFRIHRSYIVNLSHIKRYDSQNNLLVMSDNSRVPVARRRFKEFKEIIEKDCN